MIKELLEGIHLVASLEAISLGTKAGIHPWIIYDIISNAAGNSWFVPTRSTYYLHFFNDSGLMFYSQSQNTIENMIYRSSL